MCCCHREDLRLEVKKIYKNPDVSSIKRNTPSNSPRHFLFLSFCSFFNEGQVFQIKDLYIWNSIVKQKFDRIWECALYIERQSIDCSLSLFTLSDLAHFIRPMEMKDFLFKKKK